MNCLKLKTVTAIFVFFAVAVVIPLAEAQDNLVFDCNEVDGIQTLPGMFDIVNASANKTEFTNLNCRFRRDIDGTFPEHLPNLPNLDTVYVSETRF